MGAGVAEHPSGSVDVQDHRQGARGSGRADDPHRNITVGAAGHLDPLVGDLRLGDLTGLRLVDDLSTPLGAQVVEERGVGGRVGELLSGTARAGRDGSRQSLC